MHKHNYISEDAHNVANAYLTRPALAHTQGQQKYCPLLPLKAKEEGEQLQIVVLSCIYC